MTQSVIVIRNLGRNVRRTVLTVLTIALAILACTTVAGFPYLFSHIVGSPNSARCIVPTNKSGFFLFLPDAYRAKIQAIPHIHSSAATTSASEAAFVLSMFDFKSLLLAFNAIAAVAVIAMSLVVVNTMALAARERRNEAAVMRALGYTPARIAMLILAESAAIGLAGGVVGCAIAYGMAKLLPFSALTFGPMDLFDILPAGVLVRALGLSILIGLAAGAIALPSLSRRAVAESLRWVG